jgi:hypothetical protein
VFTRSRLWAVLLLVLLFGLSLYWVAWRSSVLHAPGEPRSIEVEKEKTLIVTSRKAGEEIYKQLEMRDISEFHSLDELDNVVGEMIQNDLDPFESPNEDALRADVLEKIRRDVVGLMYYRWVQPSFDEYDRFMTQSGYVLPEHFNDLVRGNRLSLKGTYKNRTGGDIDETRTPRSVLRELWDMSSPGGSQAAHLKAATVEDDGVEVEIGKSCAGDILGISIDGVLGPAAWEGANTVTCPKYYQSRSGWPHDLHRQGMCVTVARVGVILRFANGDAFPFKFGCWYDPKTRAWYIYSVNIGNHKEGFGGVFF